ncbi:hypothetical protein [Planotetraspora phitsanulokensis]|uniref:hypothetical protein n=1 Tax=Planotetraspora phitsanulokensis TaxID=575192 RepID=UPI00194FE9BE|nr:hypothetical protein [Planotetraspora phitsanulokensis]
MSGIKVVAYASIVAVVLLAFLGGLAVGRKSSPTSDCGSLRQGALDSIKESDQMDPGPEKQFQTRVVLHVIADNPACFDASMVATARAELDQLSSEAAKEAAREARACSEDWSRVC